MTAACTMRESESSWLSPEVSGPMHLCELFDESAEASCKYLAKVKSFTGLSCFVFSRAQQSLQGLHLRLTMEIVGVVIVALSLIMPRTLVYLIVYPTFRLVFGTLYPAYASYKAVRTKNVKEYVKWMMYWIVFALFTCAETFTDVFFSFWFPFYYEIKIILVLWLLSPATKGSSILYRRFVHPALCRRETEIDDALARATEQGYSAVLQLGSKGVNYATTMLMQTAIKNLPNVVSSSTLAASHSDPAVSSLANRQASPSRSETDARESPTMHRRARRRTLSEDTGLMGFEKAGGRNYIDLESSEDDNHAGMSLDHMPSMNSTAESLDLAEFKMPKVLKKEPRSASVTRRKPRTRNSTRNLDSDFSDDN